MIDTQGSTDLLTSKHKSKSKALKVVGEEQETTRKPLEEPEAEYDEDFDGMESYNCVENHNLNSCISKGIPPPSTDLSALISKTLSSSKTTKKNNKYAGYENFAKSLGWDQEKPKNTQPYSRRKKIEFPELDLLTGEVDDGISKTVVAKELEKTNLKGLEKNKQLLNVSEKKLKEMRRVSFLIIFRQQYLGNMMKYSTSEPK